MSDELLEKIPDDEVKRRIETAFAAGEATLCECTVCGAVENTAPYRIDGEERPVIYCDDHAPEE